MSQPLAGVCVLDFSTLLPGPLTTLLLAEAGADGAPVVPPALIADIAGGTYPALGEDNALIGG